VQQQIVDIAGLETLVVGPVQDTQTCVVMLHGYAMDHADLAPFAHSLQFPAVYLFPRGPQRAPDRGFSWWHIDSEQRAAQMQSGSRDLHATYPEGRADTRERLRAFFAAAHQWINYKRLIIAGFSQGGMLTCELVLHDVVRPDGIVLMSTSRLAIEEWRPRGDRLQGLPVLLSHGHADADLAFAAGTHLRDWLIETGAAVTWVEFPEGHLIPLAVWRQIRRFLRGLSPDSATAPPRA